MSGTRTTAKRRIDPRLMVESWNHKMRVALRQHPPRPMVKCLECKTEFDHRRSTAKFCSGKCRQQYNADKRRERGMKAGGGR